jgi:predicted nucleotidyltransferase
LRTEPSVRLAVLFGSMAVGEENSGSDVDLLVDHASGDPLDLIRLQRRLQERVGWRVHVVSLEDAEESPALLADVLAEGRVIVNRGDVWKRLQRRRRGIFRAAAAEAEATREAAGRAIDEARARLAS